MVVLGITPYGDNSQIVRVFSRTLGVVALWVRTGKGKHRKQAMWHPCALLDVSGVQRKGPEGLIRYKEVRPAVVFDRLTTDALRSSVAFFLAEVMIKTFPEESPHPEVVDLLWQTILKLDQIPKTGWVHVAFLGRLIDILGFSPAEKANDIAQGLSLQTGDWEWVVLEDEDHLGPLLAAVFTALANGKDAEVICAELEAKQRRQLVLGQVRYLQHHLSGPKEIKSYEVLESLFA